MYLKLGMQVPTFWHGEEEQGDLTKKKMICKTSEFLKNSWMKLQAVLVFDK